MLCKLDFQIIAYSYRFELASSGLVFKSDSFVSEIGKSSEKIYIYIVEIVKTVKTQNFKLKLFKIVNILKPIMAQIIC